MIGPAGFMAAQMRLVDSFEASVEVRIQAILDIRRRTNSSGMNGEDADLIRAHLLAGRPERKD